MSQKLKNIEKINQIFFFKKEIFYKSFWLSRFLNKFIKKGKKYKIENFFIKIFIFLRKILPGKEPLLIFLLNIIFYTPTITYIMKKIGKKVHPIPLLIKDSRKFSLSFKYVYDYLNNLNKNKDEENWQFYNRFLKIILDIILNKKQNILSERQLLHTKTLVDSRLYLHWRW